MCYSDPTTVVLKVGEVVPSAFSGKLSYGLVTALGRRLILAPWAIERYQ